MEMPTAGLLSTFPSSLSQFLPSPTRGTAWDEQSPTADQASDKQINLCRRRCSLDVSGNRCQACSCKVMLYRRQMKKASSGVSGRQLWADDGGRGKEGGAWLGEALPLSSHSRHGGLARRVADSSAPSTVRLRRAVASNTSRFPSVEKRPKARAARPWLLEKVDEDHNLRPSSDTATTTHCAYFQAARMATNHPGSQMLNSNGQLTMGQTSDGHASPPAENTASDGAIRGRNGESLFEDGLVLDEIPTTSPGNTDARPGIWNGQSIRSSTLRECLQSRKTFYGEGNQMPPELAYLQIPADEYACAVAHIEGCSKVRSYSLCYNKWLHSCAFSFLFLVVWAVGIVLWMFDLVTARTGTGIFFLVAVAAVICGVFLCHCVQSKFDNRARNMLAKANAIFAKYHVIVGLLEEGMLTCYRLSIHFIYFDLPPCLVNITYLQETLAVELGKHLKRKRQKKQKHLMLQRVPSVGDTDLILPSMDISDSQRQDIAQDLLMLYCDMYVGHLVTGRLRMPRYPRHAQDVPCVCQFVQAQFFHLSENAEVSTAVP